MICWGSLWNCSITCNLLAEKTVRVLKYISTSDIHFFVVRFICAALKHSSIGILFQKETSFPSLQSCMSEWNALVDMHTTIARSYRALIFGKDVEVSRCSFRLIPCHRYWLAVSAWSNYIPRATLVVGHDFMDLTPAFSCFTNIDLRGRCAPWYEPAGAGEVRGLVG